jgi:rhomboid protease GluP
MTEKTVPFVDRRSAPRATLTELMHCGPRLAPVTTALLAINLLVFALMLIAGAGLWHTSNGVQLAWGANFGPATQDGQWWRLFTAMFIHFGIVHMVLNMWALWDVGRLVERLYGRGRFTLLYLASGVLGNLLSLVVQGNQAVSGGASGAIFSLYGALLVFLWRERRQVERGEFRWLFGASVVFTLVTLGLGLVVPGIDNAAHIGGLLSGALLSVLLARPWTPNSPRLRFGRWAAAIMLAVSLVVMVLRIPAPIYRLGEEMRARAAIRQFLTDDQRISQQWGAILDMGQRQGLTFEQVAGSIDTKVTAVYEHSFEQLMAASPGDKAPSAKTLEALQNYATQRVDASRELSKGLRSKDPVKIRKALEQARKAGSQVNAATPPAPVASTPATPSSAPAVNVLDATK